MKNIIIDYETDERIMKYAEAIKTFGLKNLMNKFIEKGILNENFNYDTFKANFRRLKKRHTGLFLNPIIFRSIWQYLEGYSYEEFIDNLGIENIRKYHYEKKFEEVFSNFNDIKYEISSIKSKMNSSSPRDYTQRKPFLDSGKRIYEAIFNIIQNGSLVFYACKILLVDITLNLKNIWKHGKSPKINRIDKIFNHLTNAFGDIYSFNPDGELITNFQNTTNQGLKNIIAIGNFYLIIAYQIFLIETIYKLFLKNIKIVDNKINDSNKSINDKSILHMNNTIIRYYSIVKQNDQIKLKEISACLKNFNEHFNERLANFYKIKSTFYDVESNFVPSIEYLNGLRTIINSLNNLLCRFVNPEEIHKSFKNISTIETLTKEKMIELYFRVTISNQDIFDFNKVTSFFINLKQNENDERYNEDKPTLNIIKLHSYDEQDAIIDLDIFNS